MANLIKHLRSKKNQQASRRTAKQGKTKSRTIKQVKPKKSQQASRRTVPAPEGLAKLIELVNGLPNPPLTLERMDEIAKELAGVKFKDLPPDAVLLGRDEAPSDPEWKTSELDMRVTVFIRVVNALRPRLQEFIGPLHPGTYRSLFYRDLRGAAGTPANETLAAAENRYVFLHVAREALKNIAQKWASGKEAGETVAVATLPHDEAKTPLSLKLDPKGQIVEHRSTLLDGLRDTLLEIEARRIGHCPICGNIFWKGRLDQPCCSTKCAHALRNRRYRENYLEKYKLQRINKQSKETSKKGKANG